MYLKHKDNYRGWTVEHCTNSFPQKAWKAQNGNDALYAHTAAVLKFLIDSAMIERERKLK